MTRSSRGRRARRSEGGGSERGLVLYGVHPVEEYLASGRAAQGPVLASRERLPDALAAAIEASGARTERVEAERIEALCGPGSNHQGVALEVGAFPYADLGAILERASDRSDALVVVLDGIQDAGNLGAIARSAAAFGAAGLIIGKDRAARVGAGAVRRSAGAIWRIPIARVTNVGRAIEELKGSGFWGVAAVLDGTRPDRLALEGTRIALVIGAEGAGVRSGVLQKCDFLVTIPMSSGVESLNASVSAGILMYEIARRAGG